MWTKRSARSSNVPTRRCITPSATAATALHAPRPMRLLVVRQRAIALLFRPRLVLSLLFFRVDRLRLGQALLSHRHEGIEERLAVHVRPPNVMRFHRTSSPSWAGVE